MFMDHLCDRMAFMGLCRGMRGSVVGAAVLGIAVALGSTGCQKRSQAAEKGVNRVEVAGGTPVERGRYIVKTSGCNDCHTAGWDQPGGDQIPESKWLMGVPMGWRGPWGTSYAANLRLDPTIYPVEKWIKMVRGRNSRPPMPWSSLHAMSDGDLRSIYAFIEHLGPAGEKMPADVKPGEEPTTPYLVMTPVQPAAKK